MTNRHAFEELLGILLEQEAGLAALVANTKRQQTALVASDYATVEQTATEMAQTTVRLRDLDARRTSILESLGRPEATISDLLEDAETAGVRGLGETQDRLQSTLGALRGLQEINASIILSASKLVDRWASALAGLAGGTYGSQGKSTSAESGGFVSRQA